MQAIVVRVLVVCLFTPLSLFAQVCSNWLQLNNQPAYVQVGDLDIPGNQITVECVFNRTAPWSGADVFQGDLVSKHEGSSDCNYLLRPSSAEITTSNGYFKTPTICPIQLNKTYHAAMVYDGTTLKFYRNGYLMSQVAASGNLFQNNWQTRIGLYFNGITQENFIGYINEVRIWNVARTQAQIRTYMQTGLPNPTTTPGLLAYYTFNNLLNKQGNPAWNGTIGGSANIGQSNPNCPMTVYSCNVVLSTPVNLCSGLQIAYGTTNNDHGMDIVPGNNGEFYTVGTTTTPGSGDDILVTKFDASGSIVWTRTFGGTSTESVRKAQPSSDGGVLIAGQSRSFGNFNGDMLCLKVNSSGTLAWARRFGLGSSNGDLAMDIVETSDGGYAVSGIINVIGVLADAVVIKLNSALNVTWSTRLNSNDGEDGVGIVQKGDTLVLAADMQHGAGNYSFTMTKLLMPNGSVVGSKELIPGARGLFNPYLFRNPAGPGYIVSGHTIDGTSYANMKHAVITLNDNFDLINTRLINAPVPLNDFWTGLVPLSDGSFVGSASTQPNTDAYIYRIGGGGEVMFSKKFSGTGARGFRKVMVTPAGGNVLAVGSIVKGGQTDVFLAGMLLESTVPGNCQVADAVISTQAPAYTSSAYSWPSVTAAGISSGSATLTTGVISLTRTDNCPKPVIDFGYQQNPCQPNQVQFTSALSGVSSFQWNFGNNTTNTTSLSPLVNYGATGSYPIKLIAQYGSGCSDSVTKIISVNSTYSASLLTNGSDTTICLGDSIRLVANPGSSTFCLSSSQGTAPALNQWVKPTAPTVYYLSGQQYGTNLLVNSSFNSGNSGFASDYNVAANNTTEGQYFVGPNATTWNPALTNCGDHTTGSGNMLLVNGSPVSGSRVWYQTIPVSPNTEYQFSTWVASLTATNPANLQFSINGANLGNSILASSTPCQWNEFRSGWNSGSSTSATIAIVNNNTLVSGNDFALDDLFFGSVTMRFDSLAVSVTGLCDSVKITGANKICSPSDTISYSIYRSPTCTQNCIFQVDPAFATIVSQTPTSIRLRFLQNGNTTIRVSYANSCKTVLDSLPLTIRFAPAGINLGPDLTTCRDTSFTLQAGAGFESYLWQDGSTGSSYNVTGPGTFIVSAQNLCGNTRADTLRYVKSVPQPFSWSPANARVCGADSVQFTAGGGTSYLWSPASSFGSPASATTKGWISASGTVTVRITDAQCNRDTVVTIPVVSASAATIRVSKSNDVTCSVDTAVLSAQGGVSYTWQPNQYIIRQTGSSITVRPPQQGVTYTVIGQDAGGCTGKDSITINFVNSGDQSLYTPTAFTPNGDGLNDRFLPSFTGPAKNYQFQIYDRWGKLMFESHVPDKAWDGHFQGRELPAGVYVWHIRAEGGCNGLFQQKGTITLIR